MSNKRTIRAIDYTSRDFDSIKDDLVEYAKKYYPETFKDFSEASFGSLMLDAVAYIGDILSFYLDYQVNESFLQTSTEYDNLIKIGAQLGYKLENDSVSSGPVSFYINVPSNTDGTAPDWEKTPLLRKGTTMTSSNGAPFTLNSDVNFRNQNNIVKVANVNPNTGIPTSFSIKSIGEAVSGDMESETISIGSFKKFRKIKLKTKNITEILSIVDASGNEYYEVNNLSQDVIYKSFNNKSAEAEESSEPQYIMKPVHATHRFVTEKDSESTYIKFGTSNNLNIGTQDRLDPSSVVLSLNGKDYISDEFFDPNNLISSDKFGISPSNTTLTVICRTSSGANSNASVGDINQVTSPLFKWKSLSNITEAEKSNIASSLVCKNEESFQGSFSSISKEELRERIASSYFSQNRAVTANDYAALSYNMPAKFGRIKRVKVDKSPDVMKSSLDIYVISERNESLIQTNPTTKRNLKTWLSSNKMMNDQINIIDAKIVNFGINFSFIPDPSSNSYDVKVRSEQRLSEFFSSKKNIGEELSIIDIYSELNKVEGLIDVKDIKIIQLYGSGYSRETYNFKKRMSSGGRILLVPKNVIMEIKYPSVDIVGEVV